MRDTLVYVAGPFIVLFIIFLATSPFALIFHAMIAFTKRRIGSVAATALYGAEVIGVYLWFRWIIDPINAGFDANLYDGPVGFGAGMFGGFIMFFAGMLVILNGIGLCRLPKGPQRR
ncbi:hypothetical protein [Agrobacterium rosae]|uniref:hypothetical protein n=1 Tax=Agrobacterium rosae TaxID=1972867 RepID=UPI0020340321|nr:hypothetical protein [Agrobacterium rosae]MCM2436317.1 hypothetical protein [Agrobacterium rosae]